MTTADFFAHYWWLMFPIFWMIKYVICMTRADRRADLRFELARLRSEQRK
jgi:hypothetical protein